MQAAKVMNPDPVKKDTDLENAVDISAGCNRQLASHGNQFGLALLYTVIALKKVMVGRAKAHFDSWDGATGATDNGTGTLVMMEAMRILKKLYPNPKRTILVGHWGSEEQGLNGSRAFVEDHPAIVKNVQALFNQDNGTGRVVNLSGQGYLHAYDYLGRWLEAVPKDITKHIKTNFPGTPGGGGSDYASFVAAGAPAFSLSSAICGSSSVISPHRDIEAPPALAYSSLCLETSATSMSLKPSAAAQRTTICPTGPAPIINTLPPCAKPPAQAARKAVFARPHQQACFKSTVAGRGEHSLAGST